MSAANSARKLTIQEHIAEQQLSQRRLAQLAGIDRSTLVAIMTGGQRTTHDETVRRLAAALKVPVWAIDLGHVSPSATTGPLPGSSYLTPTRPFPKVPRAAVCSRCQMQRSLSGSCNCE